MKIRGRLIVNILDDQDELEPIVVLESEGDVMAIDAVIGFGKVLDRVINGPIPTTDANKIWRRTGDDFNAGVKAGERCLSEAGSTKERADRHAGLIRAVIDDTLKSSKTTFLARRSHVDS